MARKPDLEKDKIFIVQGGTLPGLDKDPTRMRRSPGADCGSSSRPVAWAEEWPRHVPGRTVYPRMFRIDMVIDIGTIDELVEQFRARLVQAVKTYFSTEQVPFDEAEKDPTPLKAWELNEKFQDKIRKLEAQGTLSRNEHDVLSASWSFGLCMD